MKQISKQQRDINIINRAMSLGFEFIEHETFDTIRSEAEDFLYNNIAELTWVECEVTTHGYSQCVSWCDGHGYSYECTGDIVDFSAHWHDAPDTQVPHSTCIDSFGNVIQLFYYVGKTDLNQN